MLLDRRKHPTKAFEEGVVWLSSQFSSAAHYDREIMAAKAWDSWASAIQKQREMNAATCVCDPPPFLVSAGPQVMGWCHPQLRWVPDFN